MGHIDEMVQPASGSAGEDAEGRWKMWLLILLIWNSLLSVQCSLWHLILISEVWTKDSTPPKLAKPIAPFPVVEWGAQGHHSVRNWGLYHFF